MSAKDGHRPAQAAMLAAIGRAHDALDEMARSVRQDPNDVCDLRPLADAQRWTVHDMVGVDGVARMLREKVIRMLVEIAATDGGQAAYEDAVRERKALKKAWDSEDDSSE